MTEVAELHPDSEPPPSGRFLPYPVSTLSPQILPTDLTTFKSRGAGAVQRHFNQRLQEMREEYLQLLDQFNWNKLVYEAKFGFEPIIGETYHLYDLPSGYTLSMIRPEQWPGKKWVGSFRLGADGQWQLQESNEDFDIQDFVEEQE
ncbi:MAG: DUF2452 domain-containing protein, partial [Verrucomicrobiota bacterium]